MNVFSRGVRNAFRNQVRTLSIVVILSLSVGLALSMLVAHQAVGQKIASVKSSIGNTITVSPAGVRGFEGGGNPLTTDQIDQIKKINHVSSVDESLNDRLTTSNTNLVSAVEAGSLGRRFASNNGQSFGSSDVPGTPNTPSQFTPPVSIVGTTSPGTLSSAQGGGTFNLTSGKVFSGSSSDNVALVGSTLATKNNLSTGSTFSAYGATITVAGIFDAGNTFADNQVIVPLATLQNLSGQSGDVTSATVTVDSISNVDPTTSVIKTALGSAADVTNDQTRASQTITPLQNIQSISLYSLIGAVIAGAVIILLTMIMIVRERRREIGVLKAIGASNLKVMAQFMSEAITFTLLAAAIGILIGTLAANPVTRTLVNNSSSTVTQGMAVAGAGRIRGGGGFVRSNIGSIHAAVGWTIILYGLGAALLIALLGSSFASYFIAKVRPAEVMRSE